MIHAVWTIIVLDMPRQLRSLTSNIEGTGISKYRLQCLASLKPSLLNVNGLSVCSKEGLESSAQTSQLQLTTRHNAVGLTWASAVDTVYTCIAG